MSEVNKAAMLRWVERLERNEDPQGKGYLKSEQGMCCMGVAADEFAKELGLIVSVVEKGGYEWGSDGEDLIDITQYSWGCSNGYSDMTRSVLPDPVVHFLGLSDNHPSVTVDGLPQVLGHLNDHKNLSFPEIAALIRAEYGL